MRHDFNKTNTNLNTVMTVFQKLQKYGRLLIFGAVETVAGLALFPLVLSMYSYMLMTLVAAGSVLWMFRLAVLASIPFILRHLKTFTTILNDAIRFFDAFLPELNAYEKVLGHLMHYVVDALDDAAHLLGINNIPFDLLDITAHFNNINTISRHSIERFLMDIETTCPAYNSAGAIFYPVIQSLFHSFSCPLVRYYYPIPWLYNALEALLGWSYYGSAAPLVDVDQANCMHNAMESPDVVCIVLGMGYPILEVLIPMVILFVFTILIYTGIVKLLRVFIYLLSVCLTQLRRLVIALIPWIEYGIMTMPYAMDSNALQCADCIKDRFY